MKLWTSFWLLTACSCNLAAQAQLQVLPVGDDVPSVFTGSQQPVAVTIHNECDKPVTTAVRTQLYQMSSATVAPLAGPRVWMSLEVLPGQTILETNVLTFPAVKNRTEFLVQWLDETNQVLGHGTVMVYPTNLLAELKPLLGEGDSALGVLDPGNEIKAALAQAGIAFVDLEESRLEDFRGKLVLVGPCSQSDPEWEGLSARIGKVSGHGTGVVWLQTLPQSRGKIWPSFFSVPRGGMAVVVAQPALADDLAENPQSQLNLIYFCKLALHPGQAGAAGFFNDSIKIKL